MLTARPDRMQVAHKMLMQLMRIYDSKPLFTQLMKTGTLAPIISWMNSMSLPDDILAAFRCPDGLPADGHLRS